MAEDKSWYLQQIGLFKGIPDKEIMGIANKMIEKKCSKKELLYTPFEAEDSICVLKKGEVTLYHSHYGKKIIIDVLKPGSIFGNISFGKGKQDHFAEVTQNAYICFFSKDDFNKILQAKPELTMKLLQIMSTRLNEYENKIKNNLYDAKEKIIYNIELINRKNKLNPLSKIIGSKSKITHEKLSHHTGLSRETVTRAITALKKEGKIVIGGMDGTIQLPA